MSLKFNFSATEEMLTKKSLSYFQIPIITFSLSLRMKGIYYLIFLLCNVGFILLPVHLKSLSDKELK
jgi:hypothetical protein